MNQTEHPQQIHYGLLRLIDKNGYRNSLGIGCDIVRLLHSSKQLGKVQLERHHVGYCPPQINLACCGDELYQTCNPDEQADNPKIENNINKYFIFPPAILLI